MTPRPRTLVESLLAGLPGSAPESPDKCWEWQGGTTQGAYGIISRYPPTGRVTYRAHRLAYEHFVGPIPEGMHVLHSCHNPPCCNPAHLSVGTHAENMQQKIDAGRSNRGERHGHAKLTEAAVLDIRKRYRRYEQGLIKALAAEYNVSPKTVQDAATGRTWTHI